MCSVLKAHTYATWGKKVSDEGHFQSIEEITSGPGPDGNDQTFLYMCHTGNEGVQAGTAPVMHVPRSHFLIDRS
jgi:hypothetical protein